MKVSRNTLLLIAALVWLIAGFNILRIGITAYLPYLSVFNIFLSIIIFVLFQKMVFGKLVIKHTSRINGYTDEKLF